MNKVRTHRNRITALSINMSRNNAHITTVRGVLCERNEGATCIHFKTNVVRQYPAAIYPADAAPVNASITDSPSTPAQSCHTTVYSVTTSVRPTTTNNAVATHTKNIMLLFIVTVVYSDGRQLLAQMDGYHGCIYSEM